MEYFRILQKVLSWKLFRIPSVIAALGGGVLIILHRFGYVALDHIFNYVVVGVSIAIISILVIAALLHHSVVQARQIAHLERAWDMTGKYDFPMREAIQFIIDYLAKHEHSDQQFDRLGRACAKIREIGWSGIVKIWGQAFDDENNRYEEFAKAIPSLFWENSKIDPNFAYSPESDLPRTMGDPNKVSETQEPPKYGKMRINKEALKAMFSDNMH